MSDNYKPRYNAELSFKTLAELIKLTIDKYPERDFLGTKRNGVYEWMSYSQFDVQMQLLILPCPGLWRQNRREPALSWPYFTWPLLPVCEDLRDEQFASLNISHKLRTGIFWQQRLKCPTVLEKI